MGRLPVVRNAQRLTALVIGGLLTVIGLLGFLAGESLLGFGVNALHDWVHLVTGALGLVAVWQGFSRGYNRWLGAFYLALALLGFLAPGFVADLLNVNAAANILHLVLGGVLAGVGFGAVEQKSSPVST